MHIYINGIVYNCVNGRSTEYGGQDGGRCASSLEKLFTPTPPERGSFPLDHDGRCKRTMIKYMRCLAENRNQSAMCRDVAKEYLGCRMDHDLMAREDWSKLGYADETVKMASET